MEYKALIVQSDLTLLMDVHSPSAQDARKDIIPFSELIRSPEHIHTYRISPLTLWNAASSGFTEEMILERLNRHSRYEIPQTVSFTVKELLARYGAVILKPCEDPQLYELAFRNQRIEREVQTRSELRGLLLQEGRSMFIRRYDRGEIKIRLIKAGYPVDDVIPLMKGKHVPIEMRSTTLQGLPLTIRDYQKEASDALLGDLGGGSGYGTIVLPCGSGKTVVAMEIMRRLKTTTLILTTNVAAVHQWIAEIGDKLSLSCSDGTENSVIGEYTGMRKEIRDITVCTYQMLTYRKDKDGPFMHLDRIREQNWGLIIFDEVHMLPAPVFKVTSEMQSSFRVGLTATLVREDRREDEVFTLVGPKRYDVPWSELEKKGWIAQAECVEIRIPLPFDAELPYAVAGKREKYRIASENIRKVDIVKQLVANHPDDFILVIGQYISQLKTIAKELEAPLITGSTSNTKRDELYQAFREGDVRVLVVSKVANFAIDLPDASCAIQVSGAFGSRQEEAQRLGRILRPKQRDSHFYSLVTRFSTEEEFAANRQKFLSEQGYQYRMEVWD